jgi:hypothetical protein
MKRRSSAAWRIALIAFTNAPGSTPPSVPRMGSPISWKSSARNTAGGRPAFGRAIKSRGNLFITRPENGVADPHFRLEHGGRVLVCFGNEAPKSRTLQKLEDCDAVILRLGDPILD